MAMWHISVESSAPIFIILSALTAVHGGNNTSEPVANCIDLESNKSTLPPLNFARMAASDRCNHTEYRFLVVLELLTIDDKHGEQTRICDGTIVHPRWILSALYCFLGVPSFPIPGYVSVRYFGGNKTSIVQVVRHHRSSYRPVLINDVVLAKVESAMDHCPPVKLPARNNRITDKCESILTMRHVPMKDEGYKFNCLRYNTVATDRCTSQTEVAERSESIICAKAFGHGEQSRGYYGSAMVCHGDFDILIGVLGENDLKQDDTVHVFTRVDYYLEFIHSVIKSGNAERGILSFYPFACLLYCIVFVFS